MINNTFDFYKKHQASKPSKILYDRFLEISEEKLGITKDEAETNMDFIP